MINVHGVLSLNEGMNMLFFITTYSFADWSYSLNRKICFLTQIIIWDALNNSLIFKNVYKHHYLVYYYYGEKILFIQGEQL